MQRGYPEYSARMVSDAFSDTIHTAAAMKKPGMRGNTDASTTRSPSTPRTRNRPSRTAIGSSSAPILHEQDA